MLTDRPMEESTMDGNQEDPTEICEGLSCVGELTPRQQIDLVEALDRYLIDIEEGRSVDTESLVMRYPEIAQPLSDYLDGLNLICTAVKESASVSQQERSLRRQDEYAGHVPSERDELHQRLQALNEVSGSTLGLPPDLPPGNISRHEDTGDTRESAFRVPATIGPYALGPIIGRGAMGIVYEGWDRVQNQYVAVKVLAHPRTMDQTRTQRFQIEAKAAASLRHPNLVPVYAIGAEGDVHYYVMKLIRGESLDRRIYAAKKRQKRLRDGQVDQWSERCAAPIVGPDRYKRIARIGACVARALHAAHTAGIIHRDVKPSNLMLGEDGQIWLTDFGLARVQAEVGLTRTGDLVGTLRYMSPEQAAGAGEMIDARTDVYGLGATLYELVTLTMAHRASDGPALLREIQEQEPIAPRQLDPTIPRDLETIINRSMRPRAADRYDSAAAMARDLERFIEGKPITALEVTRGERTLVWASRHRHVVQVAAIAAVVAVAALLTHTILLTREQSRTQLAKQLAEDNYHQARRSIDTLGANIAKRLTPVAGAAAIRQDILAETLKYYEQFIERSVSDPTLTHEVANTRLEIARLIATTGAFEKADQAYRSATAALRRAHGQAVPQETQLALNLACGLNEWAMLASQHGDHRAALQRLAAADEALGQLARDHSRDQAVIASAHCARALTHNHRGVVLLRTGDASGGRQQLEKAIALMRPLDSQQAGPHNGLRSELADAFSNLSVVLDESGHEGQAALAAEESIRLRGEDRADEDPDQIIRLAIAHNNIAALHGQAGRIDRAIVAYRTATELLERSIRLLPGQTTPRDRLAVTLNNLGMTLAAAKQFSEAEAVFRRALVLATPALEADPSDVEAAMRVSGIQNNLGVLIRNQDRFDEARQLFQQSWATHTRVADLVEEQPGIDRTAMQQSMQQVRENLVNVNRTNQNEVGKP